MPNFELAESDVRQMIRLLGATAGIEGSHAEKKRFLMDGLCKLLEVDTWVWALGKRVDPTAPQCFLSILHNGFSPERFAAVNVALENKEMGRITEYFYSRIEATNQSITMTRVEADPDGVGSRAHIKKLWDNADVGSLIMSGYPVEPGSISFTGFYRHLKDSEFTEREKQIAHIVLSEVPWLHLSGWPDDYGQDVPSLSPRQRSVLNLLLDGHSRKEMADLLSISGNTISGYTREVYRHFGVSSHPQLMKKFLKAEMGPPA